MLHRGFLIKFKFCRGASWFSLEDLKSSFNCKRCDRRQTYTADSSLRPGEPAWFFRLDELVFLGLSNDMIAPVLTLDRLRRESEDTFLWTAELDFVVSGKQNPLIESDICCTMDGRLCLGEAKVKDRIESSNTHEQRRIRAYRDLAERLGVHMLVFSTLAKSWSDRTTSNIHSVFRETPFAVRLLAHDDLFG